MPATSDATAGPTPAAAIEVLQATLVDPDHAALAERYQGFDGVGAQWAARQPVAARSG